MRIPSGMARLHRMLMLDVQSEKPPSLVQTELGHGASIVHFALRRKYPVVSRRSSAIHRSKHAGGGDILHTCHSKRRDWSQVNVFLGQTNDSVGLAVEFNFAWRQVRTQRPARET